MVFLINAQEIYYNERFLGDIPQIGNNIDGSFFMLSRFGNDIEDDRLCFYSGEFSSPLIQLIYEKPKSVIIGREILKGALMRKPTLKVKLSDGIHSSVYEIIESALQNYGLNVISNESTATADITIKVGALRFSDSDMWTSLKDFRIDGDFTPFFFQCYKEIFTDEKSARECSAFSGPYRRKKIEKLQKKGKYKGRSSINLIGYGNQIVDMSSITTKDEFDKVISGLSQYKYVAQLSKKQIVEEFQNASCFKENKNVISFICSFIDSKTGKVLGSIHCGYQEAGINIESARFLVEKGFDPYFCYRPNNSLVRNSDNEYKGYFFSPYSKKALWKSDWQIERLKSTSQFTPYAICLLNTLSILMPSTMEIPGANKLTYGEDYKLSDNQILESSTTATNSAYNYHGYGQTNYYRYFNRSYWKGGSKSNTVSTTNATTTYKEAEYLSPKDFMGYYKPLSSVLIEELKSIVN